MDWRDVREIERIESKRVFFFNDTATTEIYTLSLHDALPICSAKLARSHAHGKWDWPLAGQEQEALDRKSTRLNSSHANISYAVFCLKKKTFLSTDYPTSSPLTSLSLSPSSPFSLMLVVTQPP